MPILVDGRFAGSGILYDSQKGLIVTNDHVIQGASKVEIEIVNRVGVSDTRRLARVLGRAPCDDLAVISIDDTSGLQALPFGSSTILNPRDRVSVVGFPAVVNRDEVSFTEGTVSRTRIVEGIYRNLIQITAISSEGNSGGALIDASSVVGITTLRDFWSDFGYAVAIDYARPLLFGMETGQNYQYLGWNFDRYGQVISVDAGSPAEQIGILPDDRVVRIDGSEIGNEIERCEALRGATSNRLVIHILRPDVNGQQIEREISINPHELKLNPSTPVPFTPTPTSNYICVTLDWVFIEASGEDGPFSFMLRANNQESNHAFIREAKAGQQLTINEQTCVSVAGGQGLTVEVYGGNWSLGGSMSFLVSDFYPASDAWGSGSPHILRSDPCSNEGCYIVSFGVEVTK